jgi:hypothetical protein
VIQEGIEKSSRKTEIHVFAAAVLKFSSRSQFQKNLFDMFDLFEHVLRQYPNTILLSQFHAARTLSQPNLDPALKFNTLTFASFHAS